MAVHDFSDPSLGYGGGLLIEFPFLSHFGFEIGGLYLQRVESDSTLSPTLTTTATVLEVPVLLRIHLGQHFSFGAGGYYAYGLGNINYSDHTSGTYQDLKMNAYDYGVVGSLGFALPLASTVSLIVDGRVTYGLSNSSTAAGISSAYLDFQGLAGLRFGAVTK